MIQKVLYGKWSKFLLSIIPVFILLGICLYHLPDNQMVKVLDDEYGYWAAGSYFAGWDWSDVSSLGVYFGYGYGLFVLNFILRWTSSAVVAYKTALVINALFLCLIYFIALKIVILVTESIDMPYGIKVLIAYTSIVYTSNIFFTQFTLSEILIALLYWILVYVFLLMIKKVTLWKTIIVLFILIISLSVHLRTVGVLMVGFCSLFFLIQKDRSVSGWKAFLAVIFFSICLLTIFWQIKGTYQQHYLTSDYVAYNSGNDVSGQIGKIKFLLSVPGIKSFIGAYLGKIYYALSSTNLIYGVAFFDVICGTKKMWAKKELSNLDIIQFFMFLNTIIMMAVASLFMIHYEVRYDVLIYGRYFEYTLPPLILVTLVKLYQVDKEIMKVSLLIGLIYLMISISIGALQTYTSGGANTWINCSGIAKILMEEDYSRIGFVRLSLYIFNLFVFLIGSVLIKKSENILYPIALLISAYMWITSFFYIYENGCLKWSVMHGKSELELADYIKEQALEDELHFFYDESTRGIFELQFLLSENTLHCVNNIYDYGKYQYLLTTKQSEREDELSKDNYKLLKESACLKLWEKLED